MRGKEAGVLVGALAVLLVLPGASYQVWDGVPLDSGLEALAAALLAPFVLSTDLRGRLRSTMPAAALAVAAVALVVKIALLAGGGEEGFRACYTAPAAPPTGHCERSYANPFRFHGGATRLDDELDFGPGSASRGLIDSTWDAAFFNDPRFDFLADPGQPDPRDRLPLAVRWTGKLRDASGKALAVTYVGEGAVRLGSATRQLPPAYEAPRTLSLATPAGADRLSLTYSFRPVAGRPGPYARLSVTERGNGGETVLHAAPPPAGWRALAVLDDLVIALLLAGLAVTAVLALGLRGGIFLGVVGAVGLLLLSGSGQVDSREASLLAIVAAAVILWRPAHPLLLSWASVLTLCAIHPIAVAPRLGAVAYRTAGNDWINYEGFARSILGGSLRAGEDVFYYQPGWRYVLFLERMLLGEGDVLRTIFAFAVVTMGILALACWLLRDVGDMRVRVGAALIVAIAVKLLNAPDLHVFLDVGVSESPTWALIPVLVAPVFLRPAARWPWIAAPAGAAAMYVIRPNQLLASVFLIVLLALAAPRTRWPSVGVGLVLALAIGLMPLAHNVAYGDRVVLATTSAKSDANLQLPPRRLKHLFSDPLVRHELKLHVQEILYVRGQPGAEHKRSLAPLFWALLAGWLAAVVLAVRRRRDAPLAPLLAMALPAAYLLPHLVYQVYVYYPRHIIAGYVAMAAVTVGALATYGLPGRRRSERASAGSD